MLGSQEGLCATSVLWPAKLAGGCRCSACRQQAACGGFWSCLAMAELSVHPSIPASTEGPPSVLIGVLEEHNWVLLDAKTGLCFEQVPANSGLLLPRNSSSPGDLTSSILIHRNKTPAARARLRKRNSHRTRGAASVHPCSFAASAIAGCVSGGLEKSPEVGSLGKASKAPDFWLQQGYVTAEKLFPCSHRLLPAFPHKRTRVPPPAACQSQPALLSFLVLFLFW